MDIERLTGDGASVKLNSEEVAKIAAALANQGDADDLAGQFDTLPAQIEAAAAREITEHEVTMEGVRLRRERIEQQRIARARSLRRYGHLIDLDIVRF